MHTTMLFNFSENTNPDRWAVVNDGVMGGSSRATFVVNDDGTALFSGQVSLKNNGGFSSLRYRMGPVPLKGAQTLVVRLKGDGKNYQIRIRENSSDYFSYITTVATSGEWETLEVPLRDMYPSFRGQKLNRPHYQGNSLRELTFLIANKREESFSLTLGKAFLQ